MSIPHILKKTRYDFFLIWGHGLQHKEVIIQTIKNTPNFRIVRIMDHSPKSIRKFVQEVYSFDYAPFKHLKKKTKYLLKTPRQVLLIFVKNEDTQEILLGKKSYMHVECANVKALKEEIRNKLNPRKKDGTRSEHHVIHATDNEMQTSKMIQHLGFGSGINAFGSPSLVLKSAPYHLRKIKAFTLQKVKTEKLHTSQVINEPEKKASKGAIPIKSSLHFKFLQGEQTEYIHYYQKNRGKALKDAHFPDDFRNLSDNFTYLGADNETDYIIVSQDSESHYRIKDGSHRASILASKGVESILSVVINK